MAGSRNDTRGNRSECTQMVIRGRKVQKKNNSSSKKASILIRLGYIVSFLHV